MTRTWLFISLGIGLGATGTWVWGLGLAPRVTHETEKEGWTCSMHPTVVRDGPGPCPICGMSLVPRRETSDHLHDAHPTQIYVDPATRQAIGVRTSLVRRGALTRGLRVLARVVPDERRETIVTSKYAGWVEKVFVNETGQMIRKGERLLSLYSPEIYAGQQELLLAVRQGNRALADSAKERLRSLDVDGSQLKRIVAAGKAQRAISRRSPGDGYVLNKHVVEGQYVEAGQPLYYIVDLSRVWVEADVYEYDVAWLSLGLRATFRLAYAPGETLMGQVGFIYPTVDETSRTVRVRLEFDNPDLLMRPGMFGIVELEGHPTEDVIHVRDSAVLRSGRRNIVFVAVGDGHFEPREVHLGRAAANGRVEIRSGLRTGERVVTQSQFLLDSESRLREAIDKLRPSSLQPDPASAPASKPSSGPAASPASRPSRPATAPSSRPGPTSRPARTEP